VAGRNLFADSPPQPAEEVPQEQGRRLFDINQPAPVQVQDVPRETAEDFPGAGIIEPAAAIASGIGSEIVGGLTGLVSAPLVGAEEATETIEGIREAGTFEPRTEAGQAGLQTVGDLVQAGVDLVNFPISGLAGLSELISGQGVEQAAKTVQDVQEKGVGKTAGDRAFEITGDPLLSAVAETSPALVASLVPLTKIAKKESALKAKLADKVKSASAQPELSSQIKLISGGAKDSAAINNPNMIRALTELETDVRIKSGATTADKVVKIIDDVKKGDTSSLGKLDDIAEEVGTPAPQRSLSKYIINGSGKLKTDPLSIEAVKQGFDQGVVAAINGATKADKSKMALMVEIRKSITENALDKRRPTDIAGTSLLERVNYVKNVNREAGKQLDTVAKELRGKGVNFDLPVSNFMDNLDEMGIKLDKRLRPNFKGSDIEGLAGPQSAIANMVKRLSSGKKGVPPDAYELHRMKRFIDENVTYGKSGEGLKGKTERVLKKLRADLDSTLDNNFPEYNNVNTRYSDTISALDSLQDVAGKKMDLFGPNANKATGTLLRRMMGNASSRINLTDSIDEIEKISRKYGAKFDDDIATQMLFADELDMRFGPVARTSLAGETAKGFKKGAEVATGQRTLVGAGLEAAGAGVEKLRGINEANAFKSIAELLKRDLQ
jgi:hypothetical protein